MGEHWTLYGSRCFLNNYVYPIYHTKGVIPWVSKELGGKKSGRNERIYVQCKLPICALPRDALIREVESCGYIFVLFSHSGVLLKLLGGRQKQRTFTEQD